MRCSNCPLFESYSSEDGSYANCGLFGDDWENRFQYEDKDGTTIGCYIEKCYITKKAKEADMKYESYEKYEI